MDIFGELIIYGYVVLPEDGKPRAKRIRLVKKVCYHHECETLIAEFKKYNPRLEDLLVEFTYREVF